MCTVLLSSIARVSAVLFSKKKIVNRIFSDYLVLLDRDVGQIWRNQAKMHQCPAALTGENAYFVKKIQARRGNAQELESFMKLENSTLT